MINPSSSQPAASPYQTLTATLKRLKWTHFLSAWQALEHRATPEHWHWRSAQCLLALAEGEAQRRDQARLARTLSER